LLLLSGVVAGVLIHIRVVVGVAVIAVYDLNVVAAADDVLAVGGVVVRFAVAVAVFASSRLQFEQHRALFSA